jgi:hypothetical protein
MCLWILYDDFDGRVGLSVLCEGRIETVPGFDTAAGLGLNADIANIPPPTQPSIPEW